MWLMLPHGPVWRRNVEAAQATARTVMNRASPQGCLSRAFATGARAAWALGCDATKRRIRRWQRPMAPSARVLAHLVRPGQAPFDGTCASGQVRQECSGKRTGISERDLTVARILVVVCVLGLGAFAFQVAKQSFQAAKSFLGIATLDATTAWDLQEMCGYGRDGTPGVRPYPEECVATVRKLIRKSATRSNVVALQSANAHTRICVRELLELPDAELVDMVAGWAARDAGTIGHLLPAEAVVHSNLIEKFSC